MKTFKQHIFEKLKVTKGNTVEYTLFPKTKDELKQMIKDEISKKGNECSLNHIDVSKITNMSYMFYDSEFDGDISKWNVSKVTDMNRMFLDVKFLTKIYLIRTFLMSLIWGICFMVVNRLTAIYLLGMFLT